MTHGVFVNQPRLVRPRETLQWRLVECVFSLRKSLASQPTLLGWLTGRLTALCKFANNCSQCALGIARLSGERLFLIFCFCFHGKIRAIVLGNIRAKFEQYIGQYSSNIRAIYWAIFEQYSSNKWAISSSGQYMGNNNMNNRFHEKLTMILYKPSPAVRAKSESNWKSELEIT